MSRPAPWWNISANGWWRRRRSCRSPCVTARCRRCPLRSEEHTSELQSLMRISYAVFCLKKNNKHTDTHSRRYMSRLARLEIRVTHKLPKENRTQYALTTDHIE